MPSTNSTPHRALFNSRVLHLVFGHLPVSQLPSIARVCIDWHDPAARHLYRRVTIGSKRSRPPFPRCVDLQTPSARYTHILDLYPYFTYPYKSSSPTSSTSQSTVEIQHSTNVPKGHLKAVETLIIRGKLRDISPVIKSIRPRHLVLHYSSTWWTPDDVAEVIANVDTLTLVFAPWTVPYFDLSSLFKSLPKLKTLRMIFAEPYLSDRELDFSYFRTEAYGLTSIIHYIFHTLEAVVVHAKYLPSEITVFNLLSTTAEHFHSVRSLISEGRISTSQPVDSLLSRALATPETEEAKLKRVEGTREIIRKSMFVGVEAIRETRWNGGFDDKELESLCKAPAVTEGNAS